MTMTMMIMDLLYCGIVHGNHQAIKELRHIRQDSFCECFFQNLLESRIKVEVAKSETLLAEHDGFYLCVRACCEASFIHQLLDDGSTNFFLASIVSSETRLPVRELRVAAEPFPESVFDNTTDRMSGRCRCRGAGSGRGNR